jgi:hypothetical protein
MARKIIKRKPAPLCECGCGQNVSRSKLTGIWNKYLHGHNSRSPSNIGKFKPGNNYGRGRPEGSRNRVSISAMNLLKEEEQALSRRAIESALNGNVQMLQFCLSRILPPPPKDLAVKLTNMPVCKDVKSSVELSFYVLSETAKGTLTPSQAHLISGIVEKHIRCLQLTEIEERLSIIEEQLEKKKDG